MRSDTPCSPNACKARTAIKQLGQVGEGSIVNMVASLNIDLARQLRQYAINLLSIDIALVS